MKLASVITRLRGFHEFLALLSCSPGNRLPHRDLASATLSLVSEASLPRTSTPSMRSKSGLDCDPATATPASGANQPGWLGLGLHLSFLISR